MFIAINVVLKQLMKYDATVEAKWSVITISYNGPWITYH